MRRAAAVHAGEGRPHVAGHGAVRRGPLAPPSCLSPSLSLALCIFKSAPATVPASVFSVVSIPLPQQESLSSPVFPTLPSSNRFRARDTAKAHPFAPVRAISRASICFCERSMREMPSRTPRAGNRQRSAGTMESSRVQRRRRGHHRAASARCRRTHRRVGLYPRRSAHSCRISGCPSLGWAHPLQFPSFKLGWAGLGWTGWAGGDGARGGI